MSKINNLNCLWWTCIIWISQILVYFGVDVSFKENLTNSDSVITYLHCYRVGAPQHKLRSEVFLLSELKVHEWRMNLGQFAPFLQVWYYSLFLFFLFLSVIQWEVLISCVVFQASQFCYISAINFYFVQAVKTFWTGKVLTQMDFVCLWLLELNSTKVSLI